MTFTCLSYYLAGVFADPGLDAYQYHYSRTAAYHTSDLFAANGDEDLSLELQSNFRGLTRLIELKPFWGLGQIYIRTVFWMGSIHERKSRHVELQHNCVPR
jgi:hypothetical protein